MKRIGYFEVFNGCAGDMICASLIDTGLNIEILKEKLNGLGLKNFEIKIEKVKRRNNWGHFIEGTRFIVIPTEKWNNETPYTKIVEIIEKSSFDRSIKEKILNIFDILANAESKIHKETKDILHFHQIGQIDAIVEIATTILCLNMLEIEKVYSSPVGISNLAPATSIILEKTPVVIKNIPFEITTPTGAAILKGVADFSEIKNNLYIENIGYGAGEKECPSPNMMKFIIGKIIEDKDEVYVIETNIDDINPVLFQNLIEKLFKTGAIDVSIFQGIGKKNRPVFKLEILTPQEKFEEIGKILFEESSTIGFRFRKEKRMILEREIKEISTEIGRVRVKIAYLKGEKINISPEYEDCLRISKEKNISLKKVYQIVYQNLKL